MKEIKDYFSKPTGLLTLQLILVILIILTLVGALWYSVLFKFIQVFALMFSSYTLSLLLDKVTLKYKDRKHRKG